jgi:L-fuconolactonase
MNHSARPVTIDAHQHFWDLTRFQYPWMTADMQVLRRDYLPGDLRPVLDRMGVDLTVFVQAQHNVDETEWALLLAEKYPWIIGIVGWLDLKSADLEAHVDRFRSHRQFVGVRHIVQDEPDERWLLQDDVVRGLKVLANRDLTYDLLLRPHHLPHIPQLVRRVPSLRMVIDHLAKPPIRRGELEPWQGDLAAIAKMPNMFCKISGLITEADPRHWQVADLIPYVETALELFGPERLMFGSDWPMCRLAGEYTEVIAAAHHALAGLSVHERAAVFGDTATRFYQLPL